MVNDYMRFSCGQMIINSAFFVIHFEISSLQTCVLQVQSKFLFVICIISGSMAMLCKENGITVFGACIAYDMLQNKEELVR